MFGCSPMRSFNNRNSVTSRFKERTRSARKQNLKTRFSFKVSCRAAHTSPNPPSPSFSSNVHRLPGTRCSNAGRQPNTGSLSADT